VKVTNEKTENSQVFLTIEMESVEVEESMEASYHRLVKKTRIPGFRKGKAPRDILERYIGKESLLEDALNNLFPKAYDDAIKEQKIKAIAQPQIEVAQTDPVVFKVVVPLLPTIELGDYHHIKVKPEPVKLNEDEVNNAVEQLRHQQAIWEPVDCSVDFGDLVSLEVESDIDGEPFIKQQGTQYQVLRDVSFPVPGFAEQLTGLKKDEWKEFKLKLPDDYPKSELVGKEPLFKVKVTEIKQERLPELNDEFARGVSSDFETLEALRERVSTNLRLRAEEQASVDFEERVIMAVVDISQAEFPPVLVEAEVDQLLGEQVRRWQMGGGKSLDEYLKRVNKTEEEIREELRPLATKRVSASLVLGKVAEEGKIEVSDAEIDSEIENMCRDAADGKKDELKKFLTTPQARESIKQTLMTRKTIQQLVEIAKGAKKGRV
jgi:trigger factor